MKFAYWQMCRRKELKKEKDVRADAEKLWRLALKSGPAFWPEPDLSSPLPLSASSSEPGARGSGQPPFWQLSFPGFYPPGSDSLGY